MSKPTFIYVMDPLCGWCYGFGNVMQQIIEDYKSKMDFIARPGGMVIGANVQPVSIKAAYILSAYKRVEEYSGVTFGQPYLNMLKEGTEISNSEPPSVAIYTFTQQYPQHSISFAHALQKKYYQEGKSLNNDSTYKELAQEFGLAPEAFIMEMQKEENKYGTTQEFQWVQSAGITSFPCGVINKKDEFFLVAKGYQPYKQLKEVIERVLAP